MVTMKRGRISKEEEKFIESNMGVMSVLEISEELYLSRTPNKVISTVMTIIQIKKPFFWFKMKSMSYTNN